MRRANAPPLRIVHEAESTGPGRFQQFIPGRVFICAVRILPIEPHGGDLVPLTNAGVIGGGKIEIAILSDPNERGGIIHHRGPVV